MKSRQLLLAMVLTAVAGVTAAGATAAQPFPHKPIRYIVGFPPGGSTDLIARTAAGKLAEQTGQPVVVENRPGAGGTIAAEIAARATPDGYTLMHAGMTMAINPALRKNLPYVPLRDFAPVTLLSKLPNVLVVSNAFPAKNVAEFIAYAKAHPGKVSYGSSGVGAVPHLSMELFKKIAGIDIVHVPYKGSAQVLTDLLGGQIPVMFDNLPANLPNIKAGRIRALGIPSAKRNPQLPDLPTFIESGVAGFEVTGWLGMFAPAATPREVITTLNTHMVKALNAPDTQKRLAEHGAEASPTTPAEFGALLKSETVRWAQVIRDAGVPSE
jgi:tripartite-type tricarboxylate transporter receptor subunit TctC